MQANRSLGIEQVELCAPSVRSASQATAVPGCRGSLAASTARMAARACLSGKGQYSSLSSRPGRSRAASSRSGLEEAASTTTPAPQEPNFMPHNAHVPGRGSTAACPAGDAAGLHPAGLALPRLPEPPHLHRERAHINLDTPVIAAIVLMGNAAWDSTAACPAARDAAEQHPAGLALRRLPPPQHLHRECAHIHLDTTVIAAIVLMKMQLGTVQQPVQPLGSQQGSIQQIWPRRLPAPPHLQHECYLTQIRQQSLAADDMLGNRCQRAEGS